MLIQWTGEACHIQVDKEAWIDTPADHVNREVDLHTYKNKGNKADRISHLNDNQ